jgi:hypothetical protein
LPSRHPELLAIPLALIYDPLPSSFERHKIHPELNDRQRQSFIIKIRYRFGR